MARKPQPALCESLAAARLADAARVLAAEPAALQLRYLQTVTEIATEKNSTLVFPIPIDILRPFYDIAIAAEAAARDKASTD